MHGESYSQSQTVTQSEAIKMFNLLPSSSDLTANVSADWLEENGRSDIATAIRLRLFSLDNGKVS